MASFFFLNTTHIVLSHRFSQSGRNLRVAYLEASSSGSFICSQAFSWGCSQSQGLPEDGESPSILTHVLGGRPVSDVRPLDCGPLPHWLLPSCFRSWLRGPLSSTPFLRISFLRYTCHVYMSCISDPSLLLFNLLLKYTFKSQNLKCSAWWIFTGNTFGTTSKPTIYY